MSFWSVSGQVVVAVGLLTRDRLLSGTLPSPGSFLLDPPVFPALSFIMCFLIAIQFNKQGFDGVMLLETGAEPLKKLASWTFPVTHPEEDDYYSPYTTL